MSGCHKTLRSSHQTRTLFVVAMPQLRLGDGFRSQGILYGPVGKVTPSPQCARRMERMAALLFTFAAASYWVAGGLSLVVFAPYPASFAPDTATCMRLTRRNDYITVDLPLGSPPHVYHVLLQLDTVHPPHSSGLRLSSPRVSESATVHCNVSEGSCVDYALLSTGASGPLERHLVGFSYTALLDHAPGGATAAGLGLDGTMDLAAGMVHWVDAGHICYQPVQPSDPWPTGLQLDVDGAGRLTANATHLSEFPALSAAPASGRCHLNVVMFPSSAARESVWLGLSSEDDVHRLDHVPGDEGIDGRRAVVEAGTVCVGISKLEAPGSRTAAMWALDCASPVVTCPSHPSVPLRRLPDFSMRIDVAADALDPASQVSGSVLQIERDVRLERLTSRVGDVAISLAAMLVAAATVWVRGGRATSSSAGVLWQCFSSRVGRLDAHRWAHVREDAVVDAMAIVARMYVVWWRANTLWRDGLSRTVLLQAIATAVSLLHYIVRWTLVTGRESPLSLLGGSTAQVDAPTAVLLSFAESPLLGSSHGRFAPVGRILCSLLLTTLSHQRVLMGCACCGVVLGSPRYTPTFRAIGTLAAVFWCVQAVALGDALANVVSWPLAYASMRGLEGSPAAAAAAVYVAISALGAPALTGAVRWLDREPLEPVKGA